jgi:hypothetical protein
MKIKCMIIIIVLIKIIMNNNCTNNCYDNGICINNECQCKTSFYDKVSNCSDFICKNNCTSVLNGICNKEKKICECFKEYEGLDCLKKKKCKTVCLKGIFFLIIFFIICIFF